MANVGNVSTPQKELMVEVLLMANASDVGISRGSKSKKQIGNCNVNVAQCNAEVKKSKCDYRSRICNHNYNCKSKTCNGDEL